MKKLQIQTSKACRHASAAGRKNYTAPVAQIVGMHTESPILAGSGRSDVNVPRFEETDDEESVRGKNGFSCEQWMD